ncbi:hypothetical protein ACHAXA_006258 [Cyclostephanos tholiformis]|uniref:Myosin motor domain-containing protein n=1 Tax=Cyclostephanos tholiformis TaxID=382380 RepID=A0ABD3SP40_9STRA
MLVTELATTTMAESTKVWISTSIIDAILHPGNSNTRVVIGSSSSSSSSFGSGVHRHPPSSTSSTVSNDYDADGGGGGGGGGGNGRINWGWTRGNIVASPPGGVGGGGGRAGGMTTTTTTTTTTTILNADGKLESSSPISITIDDPNSEYDRLVITVPGRYVDDGGVVMMNDHRGDREDDYNDVYIVGGGGRGGGPRDDDDEDGPLGYPDDLITLTHLHEPAVVHCLWRRYEMDGIYTNTGPILIALNPFKACSDLYSDAVMRRYWERGEARMITGGGGDGGGGGGKGGKVDDDDDDDSRAGGGKGRYGNDAPLPPHVYDLADSTYRSMMIKMDVEGGVGGGGGGGGGGGSRRHQGGVGSGCDQSILVSGESGAGKTVTTKFIMQYLATLSERRAESRKTNESGGGVVGRTSSSSGRGGKTSSSDGKKGGRRMRRPSIASTLQYSDVDHRHDVGIEEQVLQSNPILESFGNARTIRNDNSSRFGKFIEIRFDSYGTLVGASVETYLLEKVRLICQSEGERNYHVFYEMLRGMSDDDKRRFLLDEYDTPMDFRITSRSGTYDRRDGINDADTYGDLVEALDVMGFPAERQCDLFGVASAILHLSNISINPIRGGEECEIDGTNVHLGPVLELLGVTRENLNQAICYFKIEARGQSYTRAVQKDKAEKGLEALMKATYSAMFDFIVSTINSSITVKKTGGGGGGGGGGRAALSRGESSSSVSAFIGVLDIFGFESFRTNSFEQLCINYCNEALQQQFNLFVLKNEQDIYQQEGISWSFISFPDNQDALDLIWKKGYGILNILDDQCRAPGTTDKTFANDLYQKLTNKPRFEANFRQMGARQFGVLHYAGLVEYSTDGFVEKNKDELPREATDLLLSSSSAFIRELAAIISSSSASPDQIKSAAPTRGGKKSVTVGGHFASQLQSLRAKIELTSPHYVRCLKPNSLLVPDNFDPLMIVDQLRCAGVVEAVRVSRVGYPQRYNHSQFVSRYRTLGLREMKKAAKSSSRKMKPVVVLVEAIARKMLDFMDKSPSAKSTPVKKKDQKSNSEGIVDLLAVGIQVGKTKVFLRRRAFDVLEQMRKGHMSTAAIKVQAIARGYIHRRAYNECCEASLQLQCWIRVIIAVRKVQLARDNFNAQRIQSIYRQYKARTVYFSVLTIVRWSQRWLRGSLGRARYNNLSNLRRSAITIQCAVRVRQSCQILAKLKHDAKNLQNVTEERDKFRERMELMRIEMEWLRLAAKKEDDDAARLMSQANLQNEIVHLRNELATVTKKLDGEIKRSEKAIQSAQSIKLQLETAHKTIALLEIKLAETGHPLTNDNASIMLQEELDEALSLARKRDEEIKRLKSELNKNGSVLSKPQAFSNNFGESREEDSNEVAALRIEIEKSKMEQSLASTHDGLSEYTSLSSVLEMKRLREENKGLKEELYQSSCQLSLVSESAMSESKSSSEKKLKKEISKLKEANKKILETAEEQYASLVDLEKSNAELKSEIECLKNAALAGLATDANSYDNLTARLARAELRLKAEQTRAEEAVAREAKLRTELAEMRSFKHNQNGLLMHQSIDEEEQCDEISTLQYEVERLRSELRVAKENVRPAQHIPHAEDISHKYDELKRIIVQKDLTIEKLKLRIRTQDAELKSVAEEVTEEDLMFGMRDYRDGNAAVAAAENEGLHALNDELSRQLEKYAEELEDVKKRLKEEETRSEMEIKAFSVALMGVDELRVAAENMSRQLHIIKTNGYVPPGGLTGEDTSRNIQSAMRAVESMARANQSIDHPSISGKATQQSGFNLWNIMNAVMSPTTKQTS